MEGSSQIRLWILVSEYLTISEVALGLELCCWRLHSLLDNDEIWREKAQQFLTHRSGDIAHPRTYLKMAYMQSRRVIGSIHPGQVVTISFDWRQRKVIVHQQLPFRDVRSACILRNGDVFGKTSSFSIFDSYTSELFSIAAPKFDDISGLSVAGKDCVYYVCKDFVQKYDIERDWWGEFLALRQHPLNALRYFGFLYVVHLQGVTKIDTKTQWAEYLPGRDKLSQHFYLCSFLSDGMPVMISHYSLVVGTSRSVALSSSATKQIPQYSQGLFEDSGFVYFGTARKVFKFDKKNLVFEQCSFEDVDFSLATCRKVVASDEKYIKKRTQGSEVR